MNTVIKRVQIYIERMLFMMAMFFAQRVILGKTAFAEVSSALKAGCAEVLIDSGLSDLVPEAYRHPAP